MRFLKVGGVVFGALLITTLGISASDTLRGNADSLLGQITGSQQEGVCPEGMSEVVVGQTFSCIDTYEVSVGEGCPVQNPQSMQHTQENINTLECAPVSQTESRPWTYVTRSQAQALCARAGKRLPDSAEWYTAALGTIDTTEACNIDSSSAIATGAHSSCRSAVGAFDMVGNVWEWVADDVHEGQYRERVLPTEGYVAEVDVAGVALETGGAPSEAYGEDYFWHEPGGSYGMLRGGFFGSREDAGLYAVHTKTEPSAAAVAVGFRCVR